MSYELVDAVNQQCELKNGATKLLILTKFAELVANPANPQCRVCLSRFMAMTRLDRSTVQRHLHELHDSGLLECLDGDKVRGDKPKLYRLNLPEGFDRNVVNVRRRKYYGGKPFIMEYFEDNSAFGSEADNSLSPIPVGGEDADGLCNLHRIQSNLPRIQSNLPRIQSNLPQIQSNLPPYNNIRNKKDNNNKGKGVVVDDEVGFILSKAAKATGGKPQSFANLGITSENAKTALEAIRSFTELRENNPASVKQNPVLYLKRMISEALKTDGGNLCAGSLEPPPAKSARERAVETRWQDFMLDGHKLNTLGMDRVTKLWNELFGHLSQCPSETFVSQVEEMVNRFNAENPVTPTDPNELFAAIHRAIASLADATA